MKDAACFQSEVLWQCCMVVSGKLRGLKAVQLSQGFGAGSAGQICYQRTSSQGSDSHQPASTCKNNNEKHTAQSGRSINHILDWLSWVLSPSGIHGCQWSNAGVQHSGNPQLTVPSSTTKEHPLYIHLDAPNVFCSLPISVPNNNSELHNTTFLSSSDNNNKLCIAETCTFMLALLEIVTPTESLLCSQRLTNTIHFLQISFNLTSVLLSPKVYFIYLDNADCSLMSSSSFSTEHTVIAQYLFKWKKKKPQGATQRYLILKRQHVIMISGSIAVNNGEALITQWYRYT